MQRFKNRHWGLSRHVDPNFGKLSTALTTVLIEEDPEEGPVDIALDCSPDKRVSHYGFNGRATNMYSVTSSDQEGDWLPRGEISRVGEPEILKTVYEIAGREPDVRYHVPMMVFSHVFSDTSTEIIRERLGLPKEGAGRVFYVILFEELMQMTKLAGDPFLECWWRTLKCHLVLWKNGVYHRDSSVPPI